MKSLYHFLCLSFLPFFAIGQTTFLPLDSLSKDDLELRIINVPALNIYSFSTTIQQDSVLLVLPKGLPRGYYEAYYDNDTNKLALAYYNYGWSAYVQQFYKNGAIKCDIECNSQGAWHGLHILYYRDGTEAWHAEFIHGTLDKRYRLDYLAVENVTKAALQSKRIFGKYLFTPTPSRARRDQIELKEDSTFIYTTSTNQKPLSDSYTGEWYLEKDYLVLNIEEDVWQFPSRKFVVKGTVNLTRLELIEIKDWGVEWYGSEYKKK